MGAIGHPMVDDRIPVREMLLSIRKGFDQYVNLRPSYLFEGLDSPVKGYEAGDIDFVVFRENTEGEYADVGGRVQEGLDHESAVESAVFTRTGTERIVCAAFEEARERGGSLTNVTKSNVLTHGLRFWDDVLEAVGEEYDDVPVEHVNIDAACMDFIRRPEEFDVVVASSLFGDIITDVAAIVTGSLGLAPSANLNMDGTYPSMFEPIHGSAPDIAGQGIANPLATVLSAGMMFEHLAEDAFADDIHAAVADQLADGDAPRTPDIAGNASMTDVLDDLADRL
jgi:tartrate dehydrogenase/decarboxylase/D-malate dehydrogenase